MLDLQLEASLITPERSQIYDTRMKYLKDNSAPDMCNSTIEGNSFGRVNKKFFRFVIDMISVQLVFNNWYPFLSQYAPAPFRAEDTNTDVLNSVKHNQLVLVSILIHQYPAQGVKVSLRILTFLVNTNSYCRVCYDFVLIVQIIQIALSMKVFMTGNTVGWPVSSLKSLFSQVVTYHNKFKKGIISSWGDYAEVKDCLWIHHWVILQFVHAKFAVEIDTDLNQYNPDGAHFFKHDNYQRFLRSMDQEMMKLHYERHDEHPRFGLLWLGRRI